MNDIKMDIDVKALLNEERAAHKVQVDKLNNKISNLRSALKYERERREYAEARLNEMLGQSETKEKSKASRSTFIPPISPKNFAKSFPLLKSTSAIKNLMVRKGKTQR